MTTDRFLLERLLQQAALTTSSSHNRQLATCSFHNKQLSATSSSQQQAALSNKQLSATSRHPEKQAFERSDHGVRQGPNLRTISATRYITPLREGGSLPAIVEADDEGMYVLKFHGAGQGAKALIAELIGGELARVLGLPV
ncbi:MAG: hypothetical protein ABIS07_18570, partial [Dokdonella sp.]